MAKKMSEMSKKLGSLAKWDKNDIETRRFYVRDLMAQGLNNAEISRTFKRKGLDISERTIGRDRTYIAKGIKKEIEDKPIEKILSEMEVQYDKIIREAWTLFRTTDNDYMKGRALKLSLDTIEKKSKIMNNLGLIEQKLSIKQDTPIQIEFIKPEWENEDKD